MESSPLTSMDLDGLFTFMTVGPVEMLQHGDPKLFMMRFLQEAPLPFVGMEQQILLVCSIAFGAAYP